MKFTLLLVALCLAIGMASTVQTHSVKPHVVINRPQIDLFGPRDRRHVQVGPREKRAPWPLARADGVKGGVNGQRPVVAPHSSLEKNLRKGEYICNNNKICKLMPGEVPKGCNGVCQYLLDI